MQPELFLFAFQPRGYGEESAFVMAATEEEARHAVEAAHKLRVETEHCASIEGFNTDYYTITIADRGAVVFNGNE